MNKKPYKKFEKVEKPQPPRRVKLEVYYDGMYVGTINTDFEWNQKQTIDEDTLTEYVYKKFPTRKKKYLSIKSI